MPRAKGEGKRSKLPPGPSKGREHVNRYGAPHSTISPGLRTQIDRLPKHLTIEDALKPGTPDMVSNVRENLERKEAAILADIQGIPQRRKNRRRW